MSAWFLQAGRERGHKFAVIGPSGLRWTADRDEATSFDSKADALVEQMELVADLGVQVAVVSAAVAPKHPARSRADLDRAIAGLHEAGMLNRDSIAAVNAAAEW